MTNFCFFLFSLFLILGYTHSNPVESSTLSSSTTLIEIQRALLNNDTVVSLRSSANDTETEVPDEEWTYENSPNSTTIDTRRILYSKTVEKGKRPYMVYLQLTKESAKAHKYRGWLCGGVIVDKYYVLTSAACVEDADKFYIVSGTTKFVDSFDYKSNQCVCKNRRRVVWKCVPKNYKFDFQDSIKWSSNDVAIVKVDKPFKFGVKENGCEFATDLICYNNISRALEKPGTKGFIAGWGSGNNFREGVYRRADVHIPKNAKCLQEAKVCVMDNQACAKKWSEKFRSIISEYMICTKDVLKKLSEICDKKYANCKDVEARRVADNTTIAEVQSGKIFNVDLGRHLKDPNDYTARRNNNPGGFCENDHGGPLIVKYKGKERVIGVISACKIDPKSHSCHGPFLYTSVFKNRQFLSCAINKDVEAEGSGDQGCRRVFRSGITHEEWDVDWSGYKEDDEDDDDKDALRQKVEEKGSKEAKDQKVARASSDVDDKKSEVKKEKDEKKEKDDKKEAKTEESSSKKQKASSKKKEEKVAREKSDEDKKAESAAKAVNKKESSKKKE